MNLIKIKANLITKDYNDVFSINLEEHCRQLNNNTMGKSKNFK